ncbi:hypothetical protein LINPERPRIM_LOCUS712 [Linum perenne]
MNLGSCSISIAEMHEAIRGLELTWDEGYKKVVIRLDYMAACQLLTIEGNSEHKQDFIFHNPSHCLPTKTLIPFMRPHRHQQTHTSIIFVRFGPNPHRLHLENLHVSIFRDPSPCLPTKTLISIVGPHRHQHAHTNMILSALGQAHTNVLFGSFPKCLILV